MRLSPSNPPAVLYRLQLLGLDLTAVATCYFLELYVRSPSLGDFYSAAEKAPVVLGILALTLIVVLALVGGYDPMTDLMGVRFMSEHLIASGGAVGLTLIAVFTLPGVRSIAPGIQSLATTVFLFTVASLSYRRSFAAAFYHRAGKRRLFILGAGERVVDLFRLAQRRKLPFRLEFFDPVGGLAGIPVDPADEASPVVRDDLLAALEAAGADVVLVVIAEAPEALPKPLLERLVYLHFHRVEVQTLDNFYARNLKVVPVDILPPLWGFDEGFRLNQSLTFDRVKRFGDFIAAALALAFLWPLMLVVALCIRVDSRGPALFRQERVGRNQETFVLMKFRTMVEGSDAAGGEEALYTRVGDARVTRAGRVLRKYRLDELPQLWNVLRGDMSLIGPRPEWVRCVEIYEREIVHYHFRHLVRPGITGWAQVNHSYGEGSEDAVAKLQYDLYYVRHYSFLLDLSIVLKTIYVLLHGKGQ